MLLTPAYLPDGFQATTEPTRFTADWHTTYAHGESKIEILGDISADWGDNRGVESVTVRHHAAEMGLINAPGEYAVTWLEDAPCATPFAVVGVGVTSDSLLRVAQSLQ